MIWSVQPHDESDAGLRLLAMVPELLKALREGLSRSAFDPFATSEVFSELEALHVQALERTGQTTEQAQSFTSPVMVEVLEKIVCAPLKSRRGRAWRCICPPMTWACCRSTSCTWEAGSSSRRTMTTPCVASWRRSSRPPATYVFVNRTGLKVLEHSRTSLALEFRRGAARLLDDTLLFDRALESVLGNLRQLNRGK